jgi:hypothetical protein
MRKFFRNLRALAWCIRADWRYPEYRNLRHILWTWQQIRDDWFSVAQFQAAIYESYADIFDTDNHDPYYEEG